jgi:dihydroorotate dehydrogenase (NAD+) catalytic subunit
MDLRIKIKDKFLQNPIGVASGTFGYGSEYENLINLNQIGAIFTKAVTEQPREGNEIPRIIETPSGLINSIGLANVGLKKFIETKLPFYDNYESSVIVNVAGSTSDEYIKIVEELEGKDQIWGYEINLSCPNVKEGCLAFGTNPKGVEEVTSQLRKRTEKPLIIKLTPNVTDIASIALAAEAGGADAVSSINTLVGMVIDIDKKQPILAAKTGGLSGPAIRPVGVACTYKIASAIKIPVIGIGGIMNTSDAIEYLLAGASAIQIGTGLFVDPSIPEQILKGITQYMEKENLQKISDFHQYLF